MKTATAQPKPCPFCLGAAREVPCTFCEGTGLASERTKAATDHLTAAIWRFARAREAEIAQAAAEKAADLQKAA